MKRILILAQQHGNEPLGRLIYTELKKRGEQSPQIEYMVANPKAVRQKVRYTESDLNRSFNCRPRDTYEKRRAHTILQKIKMRNYALVLDFHTTNCEVGSMALVHGLNHEAMNFIGYTTITKVVDMQNDIASHSLIGSYPNSISIEVENKTISDSIIKGLADAVINFLHNKPRKSKQVKLYTVTELITKKSISIVDQKRLQNFVKFNDQYYPILVGNNSYKKQTHYLGFAANNKRGYTV